jgi:hypothetical protein
LDEPVLVCVSSRRDEEYWPEIYDQLGNLLASTDSPSGHYGASRVQRVQNLNRGTYFDIRGQAQVSLVGISKHRIGRAHAIRATAPDTHEIGSVAIRGSRRGSIVARGATIGYLKPPSVFGLLGLGPNRGRYTVHDQDGRAVGRITRRHRFIDYAVVEIDPSAAEELRALMLAASVGVKFWFKERTGGWLG